MLLGGHLDYVSNCLLNESFVKNSAISVSYDDVLDI